HAPAAGECAAAGGAGHFKKSRGVLCARLGLRYAFIHDHVQEFSVRRMCGVLQVSRSGYYAWRRRSESRRGRANGVLVEQMRQLHTQTRERYGAVKLWHALTAAGIRCGRHRVARLRRLHGLVARRTRRFRVLVEHHQFAPPAPNRLQSGLTVPAANRIWAGDLTAIATRAGWLYLAVLLDLYSRRVIGWAMSATPDKQVALRSEEHTSELQSRGHLVCRLLLEKKKKHT